MPLLFRRNVSENIWEEMNLWLNKIKKGFVTRGRPLDGGEWGWGYQTRELVKWAGCGVGGGVGPESSK